VIELKEAKAPVIFNHRNKHIVNTLPTYFRRLSRVGEGENGWLHVHRMYKIELKHRETAMLLLGDHESSQSPELALFPYRYWRFR
jgi:hypothetical protein